MGFRPGWLGRGEGGGGFGICNATFLRGEGGTVAQWTFWVYCDSADILEDD